MTFELLEDAAEDVIVVQEVFALFDLGTIKWCLQVHEKGVELAAQSLPWHRRGDAGDSVNDLQVLLDVRLHL